MNFDPIAPFYEASARLIFGNEHRRAEAFFLPELPENSRVLLVGGGAGHLLETLLNIRQPASVTFVEPSGAMRRRAQRRVAGLPNTDVVTFTDTSQNLPALHFDALLTPYVLDLFTDVPLERDFLPPLLAALAPDGYWLFTDFVPPPKGWQRALLRGMYAFFRVTAGIPARHLPDFEGAFRRADFVVLKREAFFGGMIGAAFLRRRNAGNGQQPTRRPD